MTAELRVPNKKIHSLAVVLSTSPKATLVNAAFNRITDLADVKHTYESLQYLVLTHNPLTSLQHIQHFPNLKYLSISKTQVSDLSPLSQ